MLGNYTMDVSDVVLDLLDQDIAEIWADIGATPDDTSADLWRKKLKKIANDYSFSSRFALMRILLSRSGQGPAADSFEVSVQGHRHHFTDISLEHAKSMRPAETLSYLSVLQDMADLQADNDPALSKAIIYKAWLDEEDANALSEYLLPEEVLADPKALKKARAAYRKENKTLYKNLISRSEALLLGHVLNLTLEEMQWYMLRVLNTGDAFRLNQSEDVIEVYGFMTGASQHHVQLLKEQYGKRSSHIAKADNPERSRQWTRQLSDGLAEKVGQWRYHPGTMDSAFLDWMVAQAPGLDLPSHTARRVYRNLAVFAYDLIIGRQLIPDEIDYQDALLDVCGEPDESGAVRRYLYQNNIVSPACCKQLADALLLENKIQSASIQADNTKAWHILAVRDNGEITSAGGLVNIGRTRVADILAGTVQPEKGDMLYLLWFVSNLIWQGNNEPDTQMLCARVLDFMDVSREVLALALLPEFYPPHLMEQSMLLSIIYSGHHGEDPSVVYEYTLYILTRQRERAAGSRRHSEDEKIRIVQHYRAHPELTLDECAAAFQIAPQTLSAWQQSLLKDGKI